MLATLETQVGRYNNTNMKFISSFIFSLVAAAAAENGSYAPQHIHPDACRFLSAEKCQAQDMAALKRQQARRSRRALGGLNQGDIKALVVLVRFPDHADRVLPTREYIQELCDGAGDNTIQKYFKEQSYGTYNIKCDVKDWVTTDKTEAEYSEGNSGNLGPDRAADFAIPALMALDNEPLEFLDYDSNEDGIFDAVLIVHSGFSAVQIGGEQCGNNEKNRIRSQGVIGSDSWEDSVWNLQLSNYAIASAFTRVCNFDNFAHMGVMTHEWIHSLGDGPIDTYDTSTGKIGGLGSFDIMAHPGGYSGSLESPGSMSPFSKQRAGWLTYTDITEDGVYTIRPSNTHAEVYSITSKFPDGQYLVFENRQKTSFDAQLFGDSGGLMIYYADENVSRYGTKGFPGQDGWPGNGNRYKFALLPRDRNYDLEKGVNNGDAGDLWTPGSVLGPGTDGLYPNTDTYTDGPTGITISDISDEGNGVMSFRVTGLALSSTNDAPTMSPTVPKTNPSPNESPTVDAGGQKTPTFDSEGQKEPAPTGDPRNSCTGVKAGDINMWAMNSAEPDEVTFFSIVKVPDSVGELYITDNAWTGSKLQTKEGTMMVSLKN